MADQKRLLVVDDDIGFGRFLGEFLRSKGYRADCLNSATEVFKTLTEKSYDLVLLDVMLPGKSGIELSEEIASRLDAPPPILLMTGFSRETSRLLGQQAQPLVRNILIKPFSLNQLHREISTVFGETLDVVEAPRHQIEGSLADSGLPQLIHTLYTLKATGLLQVENSGLKKVVYFEQGYPVFIRSNLVRECLGQMLFNSGLINQQQLDDSLQQVKQTGRQQGTVLMEMGLLTPHQLRDELRTQVIEKLLESFAWPAGEYRFQHGKSLKQELTRIDISPAALIYQGIRRHFTQARLEKFLQPHRRRYLVQTENPHYRYQEMGFEERDRKIFALCRGELTLDQILERFPLARLEIEQLLAALLTVEMIESRETAIAMEPTGAVDGFPGDTGELREQILAEFSEKMQLDFFNLLGVPQTASRQDIRRVYFELAKRYHPDRYLSYNLSPDLTEKVNQLFARIGEAYNTLNDANRRNLYQQQLKTGGADAGPKIEDILKAETAYQKGRHLLRSNKFADALPQLEIAYRLSPEEPEYLTHYGWALYRAGEGSDHQQLGKELLLRSVGLNNRIDTTHLFLGYLNKEEGMIREAEKQFERAIQCNPDCTEALRELRLFNLRKGQEDKPKGLLRRVLKKD